MRLVAKVCERCGWRVTRAIGVDSAGIAVEVGGCIEGGIADREMLPWVSEVAQQLEARLAFCPYVLEHVLESGG